MIILMSVLAAPKNCSYRFKPWFTPGSNSGLSAEEGDELERWESVSL